MTKKDLLNLKSGSEIAFEKLYNEHYKLIKQICFFNCQNNGVAEDLAQETFIRLWNNKENIDINKNIKYYLTTIAKNLCNDYFRSKNIEQQSFPYLVEDNATDEIGDSINNDEDNIFKSIKQYLDKESYEILILYYVHNLKYREIALIKETTTATITNKASRAIRLLKEKLKDE